MTRVLPCFLLLAACTGIQETRVYAGPQRPVAGACNPPSRATLTRRGHAIVLAPGDGTLTLEGTISGNTLSAGTTLVGVDKLPYPITFTGQLAGPQVNGTLATRQCRYALTLTLTDD